MLAITCLALDGYPSANEPGWCPAVGIDLANRCASQLLSARSAFGCAFSWFTLCFRDYPWYLAIFLVAEADPSNPDVALFHERCRAG